jgi:hypothetical protein
LSLTTPLLAQKTDTDKTDQLINRRVFILHFVNATKSDAFSDPLDKTKSFEMISSDKWQEFVESEKFRKEDAWTEKKAVEAGKLAAADVVVIGKFVAMGDKIQIFSKAIELSSRRVMVSRNKTAPLDNNLFAAINEMTAEMSAEMKEKLPPLPQRTITVEREKYITVEKPVENGHARSLQGELTLGGMFWRNLLLPGMGQVYAGSWHG